MLFLVMTVVPLLRHPDLRGSAFTILSVTGKKFKNVAWASLVTLVFTGVFQAWYKLRFTEPGMLMKNPYTHVLFTKIAMVLVILGLSAYHDFGIGPKAMRAWESDAESPETQQLRKQARLIGRATMGLSMLVLVFAVMLSHHNF